MCCCHLPASIGLPQPSCHYRMIRRLDSSHTSHILSIHRQTSIHTLHIHVCYIVRSASCAQPSAHLQFDQLTHSSSSRSPRPRLCLSLVLSVTTLLLLRSSLSFHLYYTKVSHIAHLPSQLRDCSAARYPFSYDTTARSSSFRGILVPLASSADSSCRSGETTVCPSLTRAFHCCLVVLCRGWCQMSGWDAYINALRGDGSVINGAAIYGQVTTPHSTTRSTRSPLINRTPCSRHSHARLIFHPVVRHPRSLPASQLSTSRQLLITCGSTACRAPMY